MTKIHYPRLNSSRALCNWNIQLPVAGLKTSGLFFSVSKNKRCATCEKRLRATGFDLNKWIVSEGGEL